MFQALSSGAFAGLVPTLDSLRSERIPGSHLSRSKILWSEPCMFGYPSQHSRTYLITVVERKDKVR